MPPLSVPPSCSLCEHFENRATRFQEELHQLKLAYIKLEGESRLAVGKLSRWKMTLKDVLKQIEDDMAEIQKL